MAGHDGATTRSVTQAMAAVSLVATGLLLVVWVPTAWSASPGHSFRPMAIAPFLLVTLTVGTIPSAMVGLRQLLWRPRVYGLLTLAASSLPHLAVRLTSWLLLDLRGIGWDD